ncbi:hypothetical protein PanWU01x14_304880 [Parasponia andersonii]|uniref:Uncharacterized protein n=1 Tax=Parasponia andersonii TaxID=3476 RepID=A0A2P5ASD5_PARAD|nr:hypothetical protein PanWU01x14_304880 [Parasponia andersonii]
MDHFITRTGDYLNRFEHHYDIIFWRHLTLTSKINLLTRKEIGGEHDLAKAKLSRHDEVKEQVDWEYLCDLWSNTAFVGRVLADRIGQIETWFTMHFDPETGWTGLDLQSLYDRMLELRSQNTPEEMSDKEIMERVLGRHSVRLKGWPRSPSTSTQTDASDSTDRCPSYGLL